MASMTTLGKNMIQLIEYISLLLGDMFNSSDGDAAATAE